MPEINEEKIEKIEKLINEIRGTTPEDKLKLGVQAIIKDDAEKAEAKAKTDANKELLDKVKIAAEKLKNEKKEIEADSTDEVSPETPERDDKGKFKKKEPDHPNEDQDKDETEIKRLTEQMEKMAKEIDALKKRKNYRTKPPAAEVVDEVDDFIQQNITKNFESVV